MDNLEQETEKDTDNEKNIEKKDTDNEKNCEEKNNETILYFLNSCGIICSTVDEINDVIIPREKLLNDELYNKLKVDIPKLKPILSSTVFTSVQKNASSTQKWPLINLIRQILRKYNYELVPKRVCDGYTKDGIKKYKRFFEVKIIVPSKQD
jgi:hypothetical protein